MQRNYQFLNIDFGVRQIYGISCDGVGTLNSVEDREWTIRLYYLHPVHRDMSSSVVEQVQAVEL